MTDRLQGPEEDPDKGILERVAQGDVESFGVLVARHEQRLIGLCQRMLQDPEEARDATQEVFLKAFRKAGSYRPKGQVYTWLYRIAVNHCLNRLRRRKVVRFVSFGELSRPGEGEENGAAFDPAAEGPDQAAQLASRRRWHRTRELIDKLPPGQRTVLILAKFEGLSYRRIAEVMGITESAVESRLFRAMRSLTEAQEKIG
ncbi:MAG: RNA polymerase sigma factor [bacterium]|nr:RNA polymerase sigma factor [bacterium]